MLSDHLISGLVSMSKEKLVTYPWNGFLLSCEIRPKILVDAQQKSDTGVRSEYQC